jgi:hypothetical protein
MANTLTISWAPASPTPPNGYRIKYWPSDNPTNVTTVSPNPTTSPAIISLPILYAKQYSGTVEASCTKSTYSTPVGFTASTGAVVTAKSVTSIGNGDDWRIVSNGAFDIDWGDGNVSHFTGAGEKVFNHTYASSYTGDIKIIIDNTSGITSLNFSGGTTPIASSTYQPIEIKTSELSKFDSLKTITFDNKDILISGDLAELPITLENLWYVNSTAISEIVSLPRSIKLLNLPNVNTSLSGNIKDLPPNITSLSVTGTNTILGNIIDFPATLTYIDISGSNQISGNIKDIPFSTTFFQVTGSNTITGDIALLNSRTNLSTLKVEGSNTISGNLSGLSFLNLINITIKGSNTITGLISALPYGSIQTINITGNNTISGSINSLPAKLSSIYVQGNNTISGDITAGLPTNLNEFYISGTGAGVITGNLSGLSSYTNLGVFSVFAGNTISGNLSSLPTAGINTFEVTGNNTIAGNIAGIYTSIRKFVLTGSNTAVYTGTKTWFSNMEYVNIQKTGGYITAQLDQLFIDLANANWTGSKYITVKGVVSATSSGARSNLTGKGVTITIIP